MNHVKNSPSVFPESTRTKFGLSSTIVYHRLVETLNFIESERPSRRHQFSPEGLLIARVASRNGWYHYDKFGAKDYSAFIPVENMIKRFEESLRSSGRYQGPFAPTLYLLWFGVFEMPMSSSSLDNLDFENTLKLISLFMGKYLRPLFILDHMELKYGDLPELENYYRMLCHFLTDNQISIFAPHYHSIKENPKMATDQLLDWSKSVSHLPEFAKRAEEISQQEYGLLRLSTLMIKSNSWHF